MQQVVWFKSHDLRVSDHEPFFNALRLFRSKGNVTFLFIHEPGWIGQPHTARHHQLFLFECLDSLNAELSKLGLKLLEMSGQAQEVFEILQAQEPISAVYAHRETSDLWGYERDTLMRSWFRKNSIEFQESVANGVSRAKEPRKPFVQYCDESIRTVLRAPNGQDLSARLSKIKLTSVNRSSIPAALGEDKNGRQKGGREAALNLKNKFFNVRAMQRYPYSLSGPNTAPDGCSRLSPYLTYGVVSDREVMHWVNDAVTKAHSTLSPQEFEKFQSTARFYLDRLSWRQGYFQAAESNPMVQIEPILPTFKGVKEAEFIEELLFAWHTGNTGYPFIDAGMRWLNATGYCNMRMRATLMSFGAHLLWLPTDKLALHLGRQFTDFCPAIHFVITQLIAGSTHFSQVMVYNPVGQSQEFDPKGVFIRHWCPELKAVPLEYLHTPWEMPLALQESIGVVIGHTYPAPVVDYERAMSAAKNRTQALREGDKTYNSGFFKERLAKLAEQKQDSLF